MAVPEQRERSLAEQRALYGASLAEVLHPVRSALGLTQARLAQVMGLSAPMLSQLLQGQRVKIGNPMALSRMDALVQLAEESEALSAAEVESRIERIAASKVRTTQASSPTDLREALLAIAPEESLRAAVDSLRQEHPEVAAGLEQLLG